MHGRLIRLFVPLYVASLAIVGMAWAREAAARAGAAEAVRAQEYHRDVLAVVGVAVTAERAAERAADLTGASVAGDRAADLTGELVISDGMVLGDTDREPPTEALAPGAAIWPWTGSEAMVVTSRLPIDGQAVEVVTWTSIAPARRSVGRRLVIGTGLLATAGALLAALAHPLALTATRPLRRLGDTARALVGGRLSARADDRHGPDEVTAVAASVNRLAELMAEAIERERIFVTSASHHFGNLLTPLRLRVEILQAESQPAARRRVDEVMVELDRLEAVADQLMQLNRAENDETTPATIDITDLVDDTIRSWQPVAEFAGVELTHDCPDRVEAVGLAWAVTEILDNLIDNAVKYGQGSPVSVRVLLGLDNVRLAVSDGGPGMPRHQLDLAPVRFWRGADHQNKPGSGLGLAIVQALAARCEARFTMRNRPDGGLEASVALRRSA